MNKILTADENKKRRDAAVSLPSTCFLFKLGQWVVTPHGDKGYVTLLGCGYSGLMYNVSLAAKTDWFLEVELQSAAMAEAKSHIQQARRILKAAQR